MSNGALLADDATAVDSEGFTFDVATGEVIEHVSGIDRAAELTAEQADAALQLRSEIEGRIAGHEARLAALTANIRAQIKAEHHRLSWWDWKLRPKVLDFARERITEKRRFWQGTWGRVSFRRSAGSNRIMDDAAAVEFVRTWTPEAVKRVVRESVTIKAVFEAQEAAAVASGEEIGLPFLASTGPVEDAVISTGIEITGSKAS